MLEESAAAAQEAAAGAAAEGSECSESVQPVLADLRKKQRSLSAEMRTGAQAAVSAAARRFVSFRDTLRTVRERRGVTYKKLDSELEKLVR